MVVCGLGTLRFLRRDEQPATKTEPAGSGTSTQITAKKTFTDDPRWWMRRNPLLTWKIAAIIGFWGWSWIAAIVVAVVAFWGDLRAVWIRIQRWSWKKAPATQQIALESLETEALEAELRRRREANQQ